jgi:hypothetical protein
MIVFVVVVVPSFLSSSSSVVVVYSSRAHRERHPHHLSSQQRKTQQQLYLLVKRKRAKIRKKFIFSLPLKKVSPLSSAQNHMGPWHSCECEKEDDDKSLFFSPLCFLLLSSKKEGVCHFCKRIRFTGK